MHSGAHNQPPAAPATEPIRTLVVEDSRKWLEPLCLFLATHPGIAVVGTAGDGLEALGRVESLRPELVLLDVQMPRMTGLEAAALIRARFPATRILMMSFDEDSVTLESCMAAGAHAFISKQTAASLLLPEILRICGRAAPLSAPPKT